jgi:hypothetical protein
MRPLALCLVAAAFVAAACDSKVQQQRPPAIPEEDPTEDDMAPEEAKTIAAAEPVDPETEAADTRAKCCQQCVDGVGADTSGDPPGALNCAGFANLDAGCVVFFDKNPMTGKEAEACVAE